MKINLKLEEGVLRNCPAKKVVVNDKTYTIQGYAMDNIAAQGMASGYYVNEQQLIRYNENAHEQHIKDTLLHEIIHAIEYNNQLGFTEQQVHVLAGSLLGVFWNKKNKPLTDWLLAK